MNTSALITANCTTCGGKLTVDTKRNVATCPYCGNTFLIAACVHNDCEPTENNASINSGGVDNKYKVTQPDDV